MCKIIKKNDFLRHCAELIISNLSEGGETAQNAQLQKKLDEINKGSLELKDQIYQQAMSPYQQGKLVALLGGDHSTPLDSSKQPEIILAILNSPIDAHADLRTHVRKVLPSTPCFCHVH
ncbi:MAG: arginase family protein [Bacteroidetes bacterium]|nr:arginase family protein [Bacteroidota bacterium]